MPICLWLPIVISIRHTFPPRQQHALPSFLVRAISRRAWSLAHVRTSKVTEIIGVNNLNLLFCLLICRNGHTLDGHGGPCHPHSRHHELLFKQVDRYATGSG
jgi:hypothetical protein